MKTYEPEAARDIAEMIKADRSLRDVLRRYERTVSKGAIRALEHEISNYELHVPPEVIAALQEDNDLLKIAKGRLNTYRRSLQRDLEASVADTC